jgi:hypothetical protein
VVTQPACEKFFVETRKTDDSDAGAHRGGGLTLYSAEKIRRTAGVDHEECGSMGSG